jgi:hypothetical protein
MRKPRQKEEPTLADAMQAARERREAMSSVAGRLTLLRPAKQVLTRVRGVRTIFPALDLMTRIGGWPIERPSLVHGPSNHGKTILCLGLGKSFLERGHFFAFVDAEFSTPDTWIRSLGIDVEHPGFSAIRPRSYEQTRDAIREWAETIGNAREKGELSEDTTGTCVVDSITKLCPADLLKKLAKEISEDASDESEEEEDDKKPKAKSARPKPKRGVDGAGGRAGQIKAAMNNAWMNELVPLVGQTGTSIVIITREYEDPNPPPNQSLRFVDSYKVAGGKNIFYDSSLVVRVSLDGQITHSEGQKKQTYGERHRVDTRKTKIGRKEERYPRAAFSSSNGVLVPAGFDTPRDYLDLAVNEFGLVELKGSHYVFGKRKLGQGEHNVVRALHDDPKLFAELEEAVRAAIDERLAREPGAVPGDAVAEDVPAEA